jgi:DNA-binding transcriptional LysR family regulator
MDDIVSFVATVRYQSISKAADALGITQPSVTRRIQALEEDLGVALLDRNTRPPKPTSMGLRVFEKCQDLLQSALALKALVDTESSRPQGNLCIGMTQRVAELFLGKLLQECSRHYPELNVQVVTRWSADLRDMVLYNELHAAIVQGSDSTVFHKGLVAERLMSMGVHVVAPKGHFPRQPLSLAECVPGPWILNPEGCSFRKRLIHTFQERGLPYRVRMDGFGTELQMQMVARGQGLCLLPDICVTSSVYRNEVEMLELSDFHMESVSWLISNPMLGNLKQAVKFCAQFITQTKLGYGSTARNEVADVASACS